MANTSRSSGSIGPFLVASSILGACFAPIISLDASKSIVGYICLSVELVSAIAILYGCISICKDRDNWIKQKRRSSVTTIKVAVLWILGITQCSLYIIYGILHQNCGELYQVLLLSQREGQYCFIYVAYTFLQIGFISYCSHFVFIDFWKIKYIISLLAISNMVKWMEANVFSIFVKTTSDISKYYDLMQNCTYIKENHLKSVFQLTDMLLPPFLMEFNILATMLIISLAFSKTNKMADTSDSHIAISSDSNVPEDQQNSIPLTSRAKLFTIVFGTILNAPFLAYGVLFTASSHLLENVINEWILSIVVAKLIIFLLILTAFYLLHKKLAISIESHRLNFNGVALILCSSAVSVTGLVSSLFPESRNVSLITFHTWFNVFYITYQTIFILLGRSVVIIRGSRGVVVVFRVILILLISYNTLYWMKDSLFFQRSIENDIRENLIRLIFFVLYPFVSFYRFQSVMELIPFYSKLCAVNPCYYN